MTVSLTAMHEQLRRSTARMLQYDLNALTAAQEVRLARAVVLRLELDDCETNKLAGQPFDINKYIAASEALERLVGGNPTASSSAPDDFADAKQELSRLLDQRATAIEARKLKESERLQAREEMAAIAAALPFEPVPITPSPAVPPDLPRPNNVIPIDGATRANSNLPPAHYLKESQAKEPWERYYDGRADGPFSWPLPQ